MSTSRNDGGPRHPPSLDSHLIPFLPYVEKSTTSRSTGRPATPSPHAIKLSTLKQWLSICDAAHGNHCKAPDLGYGPRPQWLVDVCRNCVVRGKREHVYVALSYVWGRGDALSLTIESFDLFLMEDSLKRAALPKTILDAMDLVSALGLRYLWVDRLCIIQDDIASRQAQLDAMASIYANSYFTLIAAQGQDATQPLTDGSLQSISGSADGLLQGALARISELVSVTLASWSPLSNRKVEIDHDEEDLSPWRPPRSHRGIMYSQAVNLISTVWFSRGWTFQELLFSRRKIIFHRNTVNWECHCASWHENQKLLPTEQPCTRPLTDVYGGFEVSTWPNFHRYSRLVALFAARHFTFPEDALDAFAGAMNIFALSFAGGFVSGLPQMVFDAALIWQPFRPLQRRRPVVQPVDQVVLPSWSWVAWQGNIHSESWRSGYDFVKHDLRTTGDNRLGRSTWYTISTVQWFHSETLDGPKHLISVLADIARRSYLESSDMELPDGWSKHPGQDAAAPIFKHELIPDFEFSYPVPTKDASTHFQTSYRSRYLHSQTRRASLRTRPGPFRSAFTACAVAPLEDSEGNIVGCLRLNDVHQNQRENGAQTCQLLELSAGAVTISGEKSLLDQPDADVFDEWHLPNWTLGDGEYRFYNVMWIQWENGVAYRRALGRVDHVAWNRLASDREDITIG